MSVASILFPSVVIAVCYALYQSPRKRLRTPPGPQPTFIIGNILQVPQRSPEEKFTQWSDEYGDVVYLKILRQPILILNSFEAASDLLEKRSAIYSDRPEFILLNELMGWHNASTHVRYGPRFRKHRRFIHQTFNQQAVQTLRPVQEKELCYLVQNLIEKPEEFSQHIRRYSAATILKVTYGTDVKSNDDLFVQLAHRAGSLTIQSGTPAASMVDYIPAMKYIPTWAPLADFKRNARIVKEAVDTMFNVPYEMVKSQMVSGTVFPCMTSRLMEVCGPAGVHSLSREDEEDIKGVAGTMYAAAEDTTACIASTFILAMVLHPEVFKKAQTELDLVTGANRLPNFEDRDSLPYLECVIKEVCRWNPPVPLGLPHRLMDDDVYRDYHIPKGTTVLANIYAIMQNCSEPDLFRPERYIEDPDLLDPRDVIFGFGRRRCPGRHFGDRSVWLAAASIISTVDISKAKDRSGNEITPEVKFIPGFVRHPVEFSCRIQPRGENVLKMIDRSLANVLHTYSS
ncbi:hypothetical protein GYMLUDRAFT_160389 [Collybiopsis luxurians FD-317 M1]|nr:hypothetical protein GYMLUDRAFT_160389 [Collybiopsis luxurians FD-317 M1]